MEIQSLDGLNRLYAIIDHASCLEKGITPLAFAKAFFNAGGDIIQYRNKISSPYEVAKEVELLAKESKIQKKVLVVNDYPQIAQKFDVSFHVGQEDFKKHRSFDNFTLGFFNHTQIWGLSTHKIDEVQIALESEPTYIGFGSIFQSKTKETVAPHFGDSEKYLDTTVKGVLRIWKKPIVLIGGICLEKIHSLPQESRIFYAIIQDFFRYGSSTSGIEKYTQTFLAELGQISLPRQKKRER